MLLRTPDQNPVEHLPVALDQIQQGRAHLELLRSRDLGTKLLRIATLRGTATRLGPEVITIVSSPLSLATSRLALPHSLTTPARSPISLWPPSGLPSMTKDQLD